MMGDYHMIVDYQNRKKTKSIYLLFCISLIVVFMLSGCNLRTKVDDADGKQISPAPTNIPQSSSSENNTDEEPTAAAPTEAAVEPTPVAAEPTKAALEPTNAAVEPTPASIDPTDTVVEPNNDNENSDKVITDAPNFKDFIEINECFKDYSFDVSYDETLMFYERIFTIHGRYDMNGDGEADEIHALLKADYQEGSYIEVNGSRVVVNYCNPSGDIRMIDLDHTDSYTEVAIFDDGPSADPTLLFFRYDGKELSFLGSIDQFALMDGQGKFISWFHLANNFEPQFYSAWGEFKNGEYLITNHDVEQYIGKTFLVSGTGFFEPMDQMPENYYEYARWDRESAREFNETKVKILDINIEETDRTLNWFHVELVDGEKGLLYFWIGD